MSKKSGTYLRVGELLHFIKKKKKSVFFSFERIIEKFNPTKNVTSHKFVLIFITHYLKFMSLYIISDVGRMGIMDYARCFYGGSPASFI